MSKVSGETRDWWRFVTYGPLARLRRSTGGPITPDELLRLSGGAVLVSSEVTLQLTRHVLADDFVGTPCEEWFFPRLPRLSVSATIAAVRDGTKTETRRMTNGLRLKPGDLVLLVDKGRGKPRGIGLRVVEITSVECEPLIAITPDAVEREGFPVRSAGDFIELFRRVNPTCTSSQVVHVIRWRYL